MKRSDCLVMISGEAPVRDKKYNLFDHPNLKYTPDYRSPRGLLHRAAPPSPRRRATRCPRIIWRKPAPYRLLMWRS